MNIGILGGGQLGRMLGLAGLPLGHAFRVFDRSEEATAGAIGELVSGSYEDSDALAAFARGLDLVTYEFENVPVAAARTLAGSLPVHPPPQALEVAQDRLEEKSFFRTLGIPTAPFAPVETLAELERALDTLGLPAILKTRRDGYDGKGQALLRERADAAPAFERLGGVPLLLEKRIPFDREVSVLAVRGRGGEVAFYPLIENHHDHGILRLSIAPAPGMTRYLTENAHAYARRALEGLSYVGVLAIELFQWRGELLANEMAPRVHNSGHWTIEGAETSQFENHLRAVTGAPLGATGMVGPAAMLNLIGTLPDTKRVLEIRGAHLHLYGKEPRPGRKLGHVTLRAADTERLRERLGRLESVVGDG
ncbi:MAG TPA: 5-(carboxyamino)imidazole ribonucleotide synthase [Longimicrobiales bacterium]|nr:5-(carboxyamino)imidazole ribonucleotide synthase [Longimicrobiales bacterium]